MFEVVQFLGSRSIVFGAEIGGMAGGIGGSAGGGLGIDLDTGDIGLVGGATKTLGGGAGAEGALTLTWTSDGLPGQGQSNSEWETGGKLSIRDVIGLEGAGNYSFPINPPGPPQFEKSATISVGPQTGLEGGYTNGMEYKKTLFNISAVIEVMAGLGNFLNGGTKGLGDWWDGFLDRHVAIRSWES
jgi:hypothetical protein